MLPQIDFVIAGADLPNTRSIAVMRRLGGVSIRTFRIRLAMGWNMSSAATMLGHCRNHFCYP
jgi:hypothetical protein